MRTFVPILLAALAAMPAHATELHYVIAGTVTTPKDNDYSLGQALNLKFEGETATYRIDAYIDGDKPMEHTGFVDRSIAKFDKFLFSFNDGPAVDLAAHGYFTIELDGHDYQNGTVTNIGIGGAYSDDFAIFQGKESISLGIDLTLPGHPLSFDMVPDTSPLPLAVAGTFSFDASDMKLDHFAYASGSASRTFAPLFSTFSVGPAVPEPASWALMVAGFGAIGGAMRQRRRPAVRFAA